MRIWKIDSIVIRLDQSMLTGESDPVVKNPGVIKGEDIIAQTNMAFSGTLMV